MNKINIIVLIMVSVVIFTGCHSNSGKTNSENGPSMVEVLNKDGIYRLYVNGEKFFVEGAGCEYGDIRALSEHGGNAFRTWRTDNGQKSGKEVLDQAHANGLMVMMGIDVGRERHGFDYDDSEWVARQKERIRQEVMELKDHPALLGWGIGNELNLHYTNAKVWDAVNEISRMIHSIDKYHPTTTMLAGISSEEVSYIKEKCSDLDFLSVQMYGDIINLQQRLTDAGYDGPYLVTEWGATGHWEAAMTEWGAPIEQTSTEKAMVLKERYEKAILADYKNCMGSFVFLWGQKQERTPTWYGLFTEDNQKMEAIDIMHYLWNDEWPANRAPRIIEATIEGMGRYSNITLMPGKEYKAKLDYSDPDNDNVTVVAEIMAESTDLGEGGDHEQKPPVIDVATEYPEDGTIQFTTPSDPGPYRLFLYAVDGRGSAGTVNIPFMVTQNGGTE